MSFCLNTLTSKEQEFIAACAFPFTCFDGFVVEDSTPYKEIQLLFHFYASKRETVDSHSGRIVSDSERFWRTGFARFWGDKQSLNALAKRFSTTLLTAEPEVNYDNLLNDYYGPQPIEDVPPLSAVELLEFLRNLLPECEPFGQETSGAHSFLQNRGVLKIVNLYLVKDEAISPELAELLIKLAQWQPQSSWTRSWQHLLLAVAEEIEALPAEQLAGYSTFNAVIADLHRELDKPSAADWNIELWLSVLLKHKGRPEFEGLCEKASSKEVHGLPGFEDFAYRLLKGEEVIPVLADTQGLSISNFVAIRKSFNDMGYPWFANDPHVKAELWLNDFINQVDRGFHLDDQGKFIASSRSLLAELNLDEQQSFGQSLFVACLRRMQWTAFHSTYKGRTNRGVHKAVQEVLRKLCANSAIVDEGKLRAFVSDFFEGNCYEGIAVSLLKRLPEIIAGRNDDSGVMANFCVQLSDLLKRVELRSRKGDPFLQHLSRQYLGWALDCLNHPLSDIQSVFPEYATTELVAISGRGMPIYQSEYSQYLQGFETHIFDFASATQLAQYSDIYVDSQPYVWSKYKHAELAKLIRPALLGYHWSCLHAISAGAYGDFIDTALKKKLPLQHVDLIALFSLPKHWLNETGMLKNLEAFAEKNGVDSELIQTLRAYKAKDDKVAQRIAVVLSKYAAKEAGAVRLELEGEDFFIKKLNAFIQQLDIKQQRAQAWTNLFEIASAANATKPSKKVLKDLDQALNGIGHDAFSSQLGDWLQTMAADVLAAKEVCDSSTQWMPYGFSDNGRALLKGLAWASSLAQSQALEQAWAGFAADIAYNKKSWGQAENVGNAVLWLLGNSENLASVGMLTRVRAKASSASTKKLIAKQIAAAAERFGITPAELEDMAAPDHSLVNGCREGELSGYGYQLGFVEGDSAKLLWFNDKGKTLKSVPQKVKDEQGEELKALRADLKAMQADLAAQKLRLDRELNAKRSWSLDKFNAYYHEHPLMQLIAHGLIWRFALPQGEVSAFYLNQNWVNAEGEGVDVSAATEVSLWHPLEQDEAEIIAWREFIRREGIKQPLKQAYRELYLLTDAERNTGDHSLRMAGHILKQHQFTALARLRGWRYTLMTCWTFESGDYRYVAELDLPEYGLRAELQILEPYDSDDANEDTGMYTHVITDRVSFFNAGSDVAMNMEDIPARALSEVLRDCDLFVGVASIGNDPNWNPERHLQGYNRYWSEYSFGELREAAKLRKSVLENILPSLAIADKCRIQERFLHVQGTRGEYKIHIGSTNILMAPDDEYLCIVPERKAQKQSENVMLPFEGDNGFALLLSKAMMLANDDKIKDPTILSQLKTKTGPGECG